MTAELPERYSRPWREPFDEPILERMRPGCTVLDIGSGRHPTIEIKDRPEGVHYVGLDLSEEELVKAGPNAYSETVAADATTLRHELVGRFDLVISWQVLEHVNDLEGTIRNIREYLKPGGLFVALFSGSWSAFGVINRLLPNRIGSRIVDRTMKRTENDVPVFPAYYDRCSAKELAPVFAPWTKVEINPLYNGAGYFRFLPVLERLYLRYEDMIARRRSANLATHYLVIAER